MKLNNMINMIISTVFILSGILSGQGYKINGFQITSGQAVSSSNI
jgi:hypothetical protein